MPFSKSSPRPPWITPTPPSASELLPIPSGTPVFPRPSSGPVWILWGLEHRTPCSLRPPPFLLSPFPLPLSYRARISVPPHGTPELCHGRGVLPFFWSSPASAYKVCMPGPWTPTILRVNLRTLPPGTAGLHAFLPGCRSLLYDPSTRAPPSHAGSRAVTRRCRYGISTPPSRPWLSILGIGHIRRRHPHKSPFVVSRQEPASLCACPQPPSFSKCVYPCIHGSLPLFKGCPRFSHPQNSIKKPPN